MWVMYYWKCVLIVFLNNYKYVKNILNVIVLDLGYFDIVSFGRVRWLVVWIDEDFGYMSLVFL